MPPILLAMQEVRTDIREPQAPHRRAEPSGATSEPPAPDDSDLPNFIQTALAYIRSNVKPDYIEILATQSNSLEFLGSADVTEAQAAVGPVMRALSGGADPTGLHDEARWILFLTMPRVA